MTGRVLCLLTVPGSLEGSHMVQMVQTRAVVTMPGLSPGIGTHNAPP